jgi:CNT family concentrative nucleoside transporter
MGQFQGLLGVAVLIGIAVLLSTCRRRIDWRLVAAGLLLQAVLAGALLHFGPLRDGFEHLARGVTKIISFADEGITFLFGNLGDPGKGPWGFVFAFRVLPVIIFFAALMSVLYHVGVMQRVVAGAAWVLRKTLRITGAESLCAAANIFVGQTEAPLTVKPYIAGMTRSQLMAVMTGGFATIAGSVMAAYIGLLGGESEESRVLFAKHLLIASFMSAPAGIVLAKIMLPETESPRDEGLSSLMKEERTTRNVIDAAAAGATDGLKLAANVAAMLVAFVALLALINWPLTALSNIPRVASWRAEAGLPELSLQNILGGVLTPVGWLMGATWTEAHKLGALLGTQVIATEFVAYLDLAKHAQQQTMDPRTIQIAAYCLCGFANVASIGIQIGGLSALAPQRRSDLASLGPRAMLAGAMACWMTGAIAGVFISADP